MVDIINHGHPAWPQGRPCRLEFEPLITPSVQAVVDEQVDTSNLAQQAWEPLPSRTLDIRPARPQILRDRHADLCMQG